MPGTVWMIGAATVVFAGVIAYAVTRAYGWGLAVMLPLLALIAMIGMQWQNEGLTFAEGLNTVGPMILFGSPILLGSAAGILVARLRRG
jgi:hypothetical protein